MTLHAIVLTAAAGLFLYWRLRRPSMPESLWRIEVDEANIAVTSPRGERQLVSWSSLTRVAIWTTDDGPWAEDVFWGLHENGAEVPTAAFPGGFTGERQFMGALFKRLPGS